MSKITFETNSQLNKKPIKFFTISLLATSVAFLLLGVMDYKMVLQLTLLALIPALAIDYMIVFIIIWSKGKTIKPNISAKSITLTVLASSGILMLCGVDYKMVTRLTLLALTPMLIGFLIDLTKGISLLVIALLVTSGLLMMMGLDYKVVTKLTLLALIPMLVIEFLGDFFVNLNLHGKLIEWVDVLIFTSIFGLIMATMLGMDMEAAGFVVLIFIWAPVLTLFVLQVSAWGIDRLINFFRK